MATDEVLVEFADVEDEDSGDCCTTCDKFVGLFVAPRTTSAKPILSRPDFLGTSSGTCYRQPMDQQQLGAVHT